MADDKSWTIRLNEDDRSVTVRLVPKGKSKADRSVDLREPSAVELVELQAALNRVEDALPPVTPLPAGVPATPEQMRKNAEEAKAQNRFVYGEDLPYGKVLLKFCETLKTGGAAVTMADLPSSAVAPGAVRAAIGHFKAPLVGPDALALAIEAAMQRQKPPEDTGPEPEETATNGQSRPSTAPASTRT